MRESRPYGSERGAFSNGRPYRDRTDGHRALGDFELVLFASQCGSRMTMVDGASIVL